jgi:thioredoxin reductase
MSDSIRIDERATVGVVGNGPPAIALSLILSGRWPYYQGGHPDAALDARLTGADTLLEQNLAPLCEGITGRGDNPVGRLFDTLHHPMADAGTVRPTCLGLKARPDQAVSHRIIGTGPPGGSWHAMPEGMLTLSPGFWMELPGWSLFDWGRSRGHWLDPAGRLPRARVADYFSDYVPHMGLTEHFRCGERVTTAKPVSDGWLVTTEGEGARHYQFEKLVLATGMYDRPRRLGIGGEDMPWVTHRAGGCADGSGPLLVVGAGLSAADGILAARAAGREVVHVFVDDPDATPMARLDPATYPEYHWLVTLMKGAGELGYVPLSGSRLTAIGDDGGCTLSGPDGKGSVTLAGATGNRVAVLIGSDPDLGFLQAELPSVDGQLQVDPYTFRVGPSGLYAMGPLAGDNFVRFITGHALGVARDILFGG